MGAVTAAVWSLVAAAGAALAVSAPFGALIHGGQYLAGHVLLGLGLGQLAVAALRYAARRIIRKAASRPAPVSLSTGPAVEAAPAGRAPVRVPAGTPDTATVTVLRPRPAAVAPLRGRHAA
ncbi:MAG: hypothetical protein ACLGIS_01060 [Actinomycetes bacterium]